MENPVKYLVFAYIIFKMQIGYVQLYSAVSLSFRLVSVCILIHSYTQHLHFALICILYYIRCCTMCRPFRLRRHHQHCHSATGADVVAALYCHILYIVHFNFDDMLHFFLAGRNKMR